MVVGGEVPVRVPNTHATVLTSTNSSCVCTVEYEHRRYELVVAMA